VAGEAVVGRMFYRENLKNPDDFTGLEDNGEIINEKGKTFKVRVIKLFNGKVIYIVPTQIKTMEGWKKK
jgi:hypothetical protein